MKRFIFLQMLIYIIVFSCNEERYLYRINKNIKVNYCNIDIAKRISDSVFQKKFDNIDNYIIKEIENDSSYIFKYTLKQEPGVIGKGGGGKLMISKKTCNVISIVGYQ